MILLVNQHYIYRVLLPNILFNRPYISTTLPLIFMQNFWLLYWQPSGEASREVREETTRIWPVSTISIVLEVQNLDIFIRSSQ